MRISVFTPSHDARHLRDCYDTLARQTHQDWEWVVLLNGSARQWEPPEPDERVRVHRAPGTVKGVGALKRAACELATGEVLLELDHDDLLAGDCLRKVAEAFARQPGAALVFSDFAQVDPDGRRDDTRFNQNNGWVYDEVEVDGSTYLRCQALEASPHNVSYIWYAPNHVRAFARDRYEQVGGYDASLKVLDDQDLMTRLYAVGEFVRVPECLYLQRIHRRNTQSDPKTNAFIQSETVRMYQDDVAGLAEAWSARRGLAALSLTTSTSLGHGPFAQAPTAVVQEIDIAAPRLPFDDGSVGVVELHDILQRVPDRAQLLNELYRVLVHGGLLLTMTPSTDGRGAFQDPSHVAYYNENSFTYLTQSAMRRTIPDLTARLQVSHLRTFFPSPEAQRLHTPYVQANLLAIKDGPRQGGPLLV